MKKKIIIIISAVLVLALSLWILMQKSDAYSVAKSFIQNNSIIQQNLGEVKSISLSPFGYSMHYSGDYGKAHFKIKLKSQNQKASVYIELEKKGIWEVTFARLIMPDNKVIQLK